ncbi:hypothetical protein ABFS83_06G087100 [Erythranthe nasuta]
MGGIIIYRFRVGKPERQNSNKRRQNFHSPLSPASQFLICKHRRTVKFHSTATLSLPIILFERDRSAYYTLRNRSRLFNGSDQKKTRRIDLTGRSIWSYLTSSLCPFLEPVL